MQVLDVGSASKLNMWAWMQLEKPNMTVAEGRAELEAVGNKILEEGSRFEYEIDLPQGKLVKPAWGKNKKAAQEYLKAVYPAHYKSAKLLKISLQGRCFKVAQI